MLYLSRYSLNVTLPMSQTDDQFFDRADAHIDLANEQLANASAGSVSASMMYGVSRFNAWISACSFESAAEMEQAKEEILRYFTEEYRKMLTENVEDYIQHFDQFMTGSE